MDDGTCVPGLSVSQTQENKKKMTRNGTLFFSARKSGQGLRIYPYPMGSWNDEFWAAAEGGGGGKTYRVNLGGGGNVLQSVLSKTTFGGLRNWGWSGRCLFLLREMTESRQKRGGKRIVDGGSKNVFGEGFFAEFYGMFSTPLSFPPPLAALWEWHQKVKHGWLPKCHRKT